MAEIGDWFRSLPFFTRWWFALSIAFPLLGRFGLLSPMNMILLYEPLIHKFQIWRLVTSIFYYPLSPQTGFHYLMTLYFLYNYSHRLETEYYRTKPADYCVMLLFIATSTILLALATDITLLMDPIVMAVLYTWSQLNKDMTVTFWFGTQFKAVYLPWVILAFNLILGGGFKSDLVGILVGHAYYFLYYKYPIDFGGQSRLVAPEFLTHYFPNRTGGVSGFGGYQVSTPQRPQVPQSNDRRHNWGTGHALGQN